MKMLTKQRIYNSVAKNWITENLAAPRNQNIMEGWFKMIKLQQKKRSLSAVKLKKNYFCSSNMEDGLSLIIILSSPTSIKTRPKMSKSFSIN